MSAAGFVVLLHFLWILFMLAGALLTLAALFRDFGFWRWFWFRTIHAAGILAVAVFAAAGEPCPLTVAEVRLGGGGAVAGFLERRLERWVYPDVDPAWIWCPPISWRRSPWRRISCGRRGG